MQKIRRTTSCNLIERASRRYPPPNSGNWGARAAACGRTHQQTSQQARGRGKRRKETTDGRKPSDLRLHPNEARPRAVITPPRPWRVILFQPPPVNLKSSWYV